ncbi:MAG: radical SAM protein [Clostridia bacterium]|nr:radical SAM protein [Clostridia bacterium]
MKMVIEKRTFISFDEPCYYQCKHCYTYGIKRDKYRTIDEIIDDISNEAFDIIYVSQKNDNFSDPDKGLTLCYKAFERYESHLFIITRNVFNSNQIKNLCELKKKMNSIGKQLFFAVSINSYNSNYLCEDVTRVHTPEERIEFIKQLSDNGIKPILMLRPVFPNYIIPIQECLTIIDKTYKSISCVISSELGVNDDVLNRLQINENEFDYLETKEYLDGAIDCDIKFINVAEELCMIDKKCRNNGVRCFSHSIPAINYVLNKS